MATGMIVGIDIGGTKIMSGIIDQTGRIYRVVKEESKIKHGSETLLNQIYEIVDSLSPDWNEVTSIGVAVPGIADVKSGELVYAPFANIRNLSIKQILERKYARPVYIENDVNACAWAEKCFGAARECSDFIWMTISTGIGGGIVENGRILRGFKGMSGEFGHLMIDEDGPVCSCGRRGCLEAVAAGPAWPKHYFIELNKGVKGSLNPKTTTAKEIAQAARCGDEAAINVVNKVSIYIGTAISWIINILNPEKVILGGGVMESSDLLLPLIIKAADQKTISSKFYSTHIIKTELGYNAALLGAAAITLKSFNNERS